MAKVPRRRAWNPKKGSYVRTEEQMMVASPRPKTSNSSWEMPTMQSDIQDALLQEEKGGEA